MLPAKLQTQGTLAQSLPQHAFGNGHVLAQPAGALDGRPRDKTRVPSTALCAVPLPVPGRQVWPPHPFSLSLTICPPRVSRTASPISSSSTGRPASLSQNAERKL